MFRRQLKLRNFSQASRLFRVLTLIGLAVVVVACSPRIETRGNLPDLERLAEIQPGQHSREQVAEILGTPSSTAVFDQETWYYISERVETVAFFKPRTTQRKIIVLQFDKKGVVTNISTIGLKAGRKIKPIERETPTAGNEITFMDQLLGNLGRFNRPGAPPQ